MLASCGDDNFVKVWDRQTNKLLLTLRGHTAVVRSVAWSADGKMLASASYDRSVKIWNAESGRLIKTLEGHGGNVLRVTWSPDGRQVASASDDKTIRVWDLVTGEVLHTLSPKDHPHAYWAVSWSPDGKMLASGTQYNIHIWNPETGELTSTIKASSDNSMSDLKWSGDSKTLASGSFDDSLKLWDAATGQLLQSIKTPDEVWEIAWSSDGKRIATTRYSHPQIWDAKKGTLIRELRSLEGKHNYGIAFSPDGKKLAVGGDDKLIRIWELPD